MPAGLQVFDPDGHTIIDTTSSLGKVLGSVSTGTGGGSATFPIGGQRPFAIVVPEGSLSDYGLGPAVNFSGDTCSWSGCSVSCRLVIGCY